MAHSFSVKDFKTKHCNTKPSKSFLQSKQGMWLIPLETFKWHAVWMIFLTRTKHFSIARTTPLLVHLSMLITAWRIPLERSQFAEVLAKVLLVQIQTCRNALIVSFTLLWLFQIFILVYLQLFHFYLLLLSNIEILICLL